MVGRMKIKEKVFHELEEANKKEQILNERERKIISEFLRKIQKEINFYNAMKKPVKVAGINKDDMIPQKTGN